MQHVIRPMEFVKHCTLGYQLHLFISGRGKIRCQSDGQAAVSCSDINAKICTVTLKYFSGGASTRAEFLAV